jgi:hypothetical protein
LKLNSPNPNHQNPLYPILHEELLFYFREHGVYFTFISANSYEVLKEDKKSKIRKLEKYNELDIQKMCKDFSFDKKGFEEFIQLSRTDDLLRGLVNTPPIK